MEDKNSAVETAAPAESEKPAEKVKKTPLFHVTKRAQISWQKSVGIRAIAIFAALVICAIFTVVCTGDNPFSVFKTMGQGAFGKGRSLVTIHDIAILLCISLAVTPAFRMRFWNTGAEGQTLIGGLATAIIMLNLHDKVPTAVLVLLMLIAAVVAGALWGVIPALFKARWNTNETLFTLMMNYVAIQLVEYFLKIADKTGSNVVGPKLLGDGIPNLFGVQYLLNILVVAVLTGLLYVYLQYSKHGYEISVVGESENTAKYIGINVPRVIIRTMILSGAICGLAGLMLVGGASQSINANIVDGRGFTAIMVSWLAKFNPIFMILTTFLLVFLDRGADEISTRFGLNSSFSEILTGIILFFIIGCEIFIRYEIHFDRHPFRKKAQKDAVSEEEK